MNGSALVLRNGNVFDGRRHLAAHAVLVRDGRVAAVVPDADLDRAGLDRAGLDSADGLDLRAADEVDLAGGLVLPGFQDAHVHPVQGGLERLRCDLTDVGTREGYVDAIRSYAEANPDRLWIGGGGWSMTVFGRSGARLAAGSDWPVSSPDPLAGIHVAVNRRVHGEVGRGGEEAFLPEQALTLEQAFAAYTSGSAFVNHLDETGTLAPGMLADLAVLDRDPFQGAPSEIAEAGVVATYVEGVRVFG